MAYPVNKAMIDRGAAEARRVFPHLTMEQAYDVAERIIRAGALAPQRHAFTYVITDGQMDVYDCIAEATNA